MVLRVSVALCTYNGARFIEEQLRSLAGQSRLPDELVVCDDGSNDATLEIVSRFAGRAPFEVSYCRNERRLGVTKNFERAITRCTGEVIFLCDQDDVWLPEKIRTMAQAFESDDSVGLVFTDAVTTDSRLAPLGYTMWEAVGLTPERERRINEGQALDILVRRNVVTGATLALRAGLRDQILPIPASSFHDEWMAAVGAMHASVLAIRTPFILYRQHDANVIGAARKSLLAEMRFMLRRTPEWLDADTERVRCLLQKMREAGGCTATGRQLAELERRLRHLESRRAIYDVPHWRRIPLVVREVLSGGYPLYSRGLKSALLDLVAPGANPRRGICA